MSVNDLEIAVRVRADGSGLVGQLGQMEAGIGKVGQASAGAAAGTRQLSGETERLGQSARKAVSGLDEEGRAAGQLEAILTRLENRYDQAGAPMRRYNGDLADINRLLKANAIDADHAALLQGRASRAFAETAAVQQRGAASAGQLRQSYTNLGFQVQDITQQLALGVNPLVVFAQQGGQTASALSGMGGTAGRVATFFAGPWGSAIIAAVTVVGLLTAELFKNEEATKLAEVGADGLSQAQSVLGQMFDLTSGKLERQNELLVLNARLTAINLRAEALAQKASAKKAFDEAGDVPLGSRLGAAAGTLRPKIREVGGIPIPTFNPLAGLLGQGSLDRRGAQQQQLANDLRAGRITREEALRRTEKMNFKGLEVEAQQFRQAIIDGLSAELKSKTADLIDKSLADGKLAPGLRKPGPQTRARTGPKPRDLTAQRERLEEYGEDTADKIAGITGRFAGQPKLIEQAATAMRQLNDIIDDINRKKPPNMKQLLADAAAAKGAIESGVNKPYADFIQQQQESLQNILLLQQGREGEAEAMKIIAQLEQQMGPLGQERKADVLARVEALRAESKELDVIRQKQEKYLEALGEVKSLVRDMISDPLDTIKDLPGRLLGAFTQLKGDQLFEKMFGQSFRELEDQITGADKATKAFARTTIAVDQVTAEVRQTTATLGGFERALKGATGALEGSAAAPVPEAPAQPGGESEEIVVTGSRAPRNPFGAWVERVARDVGIGDSQKDRDIKIADALKKGVKIGDDAATKIGKFAGKGIEGAATGTMVNSFLKPIGKALGFKTSKLGAQVGGAVGSFLPIPFGKEIGAVVGSVIGGLFKKTKSGSATITSVDGDPRLSGNSSARREAASGLAGTVQDGLRQISETLGGSLGAFSVSIGVRDDKFRVDPTGRGRTKKKGGVVDFGDDQAAAIAFAIADAIADGAIAGLSPAVQKAIKSNKDINKALQEAVKVQEVETLLKGLSGAIEQSFKAFETQAKERVRIATQYGFDLVKLEEINAKERAKLFEDVLGSRIGALKDLLEDLDFGDLFEGSLVDQREKLLGQIAKAKADAEAGVEGAGDTLADLSRRLVELSRDAFGTAGPEYAADRDAARSAAEDIIRIENERVKAAQDAAIGTNTRLDRAIDLANEGNDIAAEQLAVMRGVLGHLGASGGGGGGGSREFTTARMVSL